MRREINILRKREIKIKKKIYRNRKRERETDRQTETEKWSEKNDKEAGQERRELRYIWEERAK